VPELEALGLVTLLDARRWRATASHAEMVKATRIIDREGRMLKVPWKNKAGFVLLKGDNRTPLGYDQVVHPW